MFLLWYNKDMGIFGTLFEGKGGGGKHYAVLEIGPKSLRGVIFSGAPGDSFPAVKEFAVMPYALKNRASGAFTVDAGMIEKALKLLLEKLPHMLSASSVSVGLGAEFLRSVTFRAVFEREDAKEKIDTAELKNLLGKAERASRESASEHTLRQNSSGGSDIQLITSRLEEILIDGYAVSDPVGLAGKEIEIALFNLYAEEPHVEFLQALKRTLGTQNLFPRSLPYSVCRAHVASAAASTPYSGIFIGMSESLTSVSVVSKNIFMGMKLFSIGGSLFTNSISANLGLGLEEAGEIKEQYAAGKLSAQVARKVSGILKRATSVWATGVELALEEFSHALDLFPSSLMVYGEGAGIPDVIAVLGEAERFTQIPFLEKRAPVALLPANLPFFGKSSPPENIVGMSSADTAAYCLAYVALFDIGPHNELARIVERATKLAYS